MFNWIYSLERYFSLRRYRNLNFKMKNETNNLNVSCVGELSDKLQKLYQKAVELGHKLTVKSIKKAVTNTFKDRFGNEEVRRDPIFTQNEISEIKIINNRYRIVILFFLIAESALYYMTAGLFVPGAGIITKLVLAFFLGLILMYVLDYSFEKHFEYRDAVSMREKEKITDSELKKYKDNRNLGYLAGFIVFLAIVFSGLTRSFFLEQIDVTGYTEEQAQTLKLASQMASIFLMAITLLTALYMASAKQKQMEVKGKYLHYLNWRKNNKETNDYINNLDKILIEIDNVRTEILTKYSQLLIDLKKIYGIEYDETFENLYQQYLQDKNSGNFKVDEAIYSKYKDIQSVDDSLFRFGILNDSELKKILNRLDELKTLPSEIHNKYLPQTPISMVKTEAAV